MPKTTKAEKPAKTETLAIRLDPKVKYGLDILARQQRRSITSLVEWIINDALRTHLRVNFTTGIVQGEKGSTYRRSYDEFVLDYLWDSDEVVRLIKLAEYNPDLLTYEETNLWNLIQNNALYWIGTLDEQKDRYTWDTSDISSLRVDLVRHDFQDLKQVANSLIDFGQLETLYFSGASIGGDRLAERIFHIQTEEEMELIEDIMPLSIGVSSESVKELIREWATRLLARLEKEDTKTKKAKSHGQKV